MPKGINWNEQFYKLLRLSLGLTQEFPVDVDADVENGLWFELVIVRD